MERKERRHPTREFKLEAVRLAAIRAVLPGAAGVLLSTSAAAQGLIASDQPTSVTGPPWSRC